MSHRINLKDLRAAIEAKMPQLVAEYLPEAKKSTGGWRIGNLEGEKGGSLFISEDGVYHDHAGTESGGPYELMARWGGCQNFSETIKWAATKVGYVIPEAPLRKKAIPLPDVDDKLGEEARDYLRERGLDPDFAEKLPIKGFKSGRGLAFLHLDETGRECHNVKYLDFATKSWSSSLKPSHIPWPLDYITASFPHHHDYLVITEGHWDAMAYLECGIPAVSIPNGAKNDKWIEEAFDFIASFDQIILSYDNDGPGLEGAQRVATRLATELKPPRLVIHPEGCKDANEVLVKKGEKALMAGIEGSEEHSPPEIIRAISVINEAISEMSETTLQFETPLKGLDFHFRPHESTIYTGYTGHGKSSLMEQFLGHLADKYDEHVAIASFEDQPNKIIGKMLVHQFGRTNLERNPTMDTFARKINIYNTKDKSKKLNDPIKILELFRYLYNRWGITQFVIDNLMTLAVSRDNFEGIVEVIDEFRSFVNEIPAHMHIVAHPRKPPGGSNTDKAPGPYDVRGPSEIVDMSFNIIGLLRNIDKERQIQQMIMTGISADRVREYDTTTQDASLTVHKQRHTGVLPHMRLWYDPEYANFLTQHPSITCQ